MLIINWDGEPAMGDGVTHLVGVDGIAACGRLVVREVDLPMPAGQVVTCFRCWYYMFLYPKLIR